MLVTSRRSAEQHVEKERAVGAAHAEIAHQAERHERGGYAARGKSADDFPVDRLALAVNGGSDAFRHRRVEKVGPDRGRRVKAEQQHEQRRHQGAAADAGHADERADQETCEGVKRIICGKDRPPPGLARRPLCGSRERFARAGVNSSRQLGFNLRRSDNHATHCPISVRTLDCSGNGKGTDALAIRADRLSRLREIARSCCSLALGRPVLSGRVGARVSPPRALAVGGTALFPGAPDQPFRAVPDRDRHPSRRQDRRALLPRPRLQRDRRERRDRRRRHHLSARHARRDQSDGGRRAASGTRPFDPAW